MELPLLILISACIIANTALLSLIYLLLRDARHMADARQSARRQWVKQEKTP